MNATTEQKTISTDEDVDRVEKVVFKVNGEELVRKVKDVIAQGNVQRIIIKNSEGKVYLEVPLAVGAVCAVLMPVWAALGALAALATECTIEVIKTRAS